MNEKKETFEEILSKLEEVVRTLEVGELPLDEALDRFEQGVRLSKEGAKRLAEAERRIEEILDNGDLRPIDIKTDQ
jgi:exodeoxyribonuclease VII small subunit